MNISLTIQNKIKQFKKAFEAGQRAWLKAAKCLVEIEAELKQDFGRVIEQQCPGVSPELVCQLLRVGRGEARLDLLIANSPAARLINSLPIEKQNLLAEKPIAVVRMNGGKPIVEHKRFNELNAREAHIAIGERGARKPDEQIKLLTLTPKRRAKQARYQVKDGKITFFADTEMTVREFIDLAGKLNRELIADPRL